MLTLLVPLGLLASASVAAASWDPWPGDLRGVRAFQGLLNDYTRPLLQNVNALGGGVQRWLLVGAAVGWLAYVGRYRLGLALAVVMLLEAAVVSLTKWAVHRPRPELPDDLQVLADPSSYSFPSSHVTFAVVFFGALAYLLARHWGRRGWVRWMVLALLLAPAALMGPARVAWGVHWPSDVLGGYLVALFGIYALAWADRRIEPRRRHEAIASPSNPRGAASQ